VTAHADHPEGAAHYGLQDISTAGEHATRRRKVGTVIVDL
jgi:hypothetical protein